MSKFSRLKFSRGEISPFEKFRIKGKWFFLFEKRLKVGTFLKSIKNQIFSIRHDCFFRTLREFQGDVLDTNTRLHFGQVNPV